MKKNDFFLAAMNNKLYDNASWVISAFALIKEDFNKWKEKPYAFRIVQTPTGMFYVDPENLQNLIQIEDSVAGQPLFKFKDKVNLKANALINLKKDVTTTLGNIFFNFVCIIYPFKDKLDYVEGLVSIPKLEKVLAGLLTDNVEESKRDPKLIYVDEYTKFVDAVLYLTTFTQLCTWGATEKSIAPPPGIEEYKNQLLEENKDRLSDPAVIAGIDAKLIKFDAEYLKGDPSENFLIDKKSRNVVRKKLFLMHGAEAGFNEGVEVELIKNSLSQGWDINAFPAMNNSLRSGSFNRGSETMLGGVSVKELLRASSNIVVAKEDCGSRLGVKQLIDESNASKLVGKSIVAKEGYIDINTPEEAGKYLGKTLLVRSPMYCILDKTDYCRVCVGKKLSLHPTGLSLTISEFGSKFMGIFMSAMHGKELATAKLNFKTAIT